MKKGPTINGKLLDYIASSIESKGAPPTLEQMAKKIGREIHQTRAILQGLQKTRRVTWSPGDYSTIKVLARANHSLEDVANLAGGMTRTKRPKASPAVVEPAASVIAPAPQAPGTSIVVSREAVTRVYTMAGELAVACRELLEGVPLFEALKQVVDRAAGDDLWRSSPTTTRKPARMVRARRAKAAPPPADDEPSDEDEEEEPSLPLQPRMRTAPGGFLEDNLDEPEPEIDDEDDEPVSVPNVAVKGETAAANFHVKDARGAVLSAHAHMEDAMRAMKRPEAKTLVRLEDGKVLQRKQPPRTDHTGERLQGDEWEDPNELEGATA